LDSDGERFEFPPRPGPCPETDAPESAPPVPLPESKPHDDAFILEGGVLKAVVRLAWPLWIAVALQDAFTLVDLFWVGRLGKEAVAALALCGMLMGFVFTIAIGISTGVVAMVSRFFGERREEDAWKATWQALYMGLAAGVLATILGLTLAGDALEFLGAKDQVLLLGTEYLQVMAVGAVVIFITFAMNSALRGAGDTVTPMIAMLLGTVVNIVIDPILIFGWLGVPALGVTGSAVATVGAQFLGMIFILSRLFVGRTRIRLRLRDAAVHLDFAWRLIRIGAFGSIQMWVRNFASLIVVTVVTQFGDAVLASFGIGMRLFMVVLLPGFGIGNAAATVVGQNLGARKRERAVRAGWVSASFYLGITAFFSLLFASLAGPLVALFNNDPGVVDAGAAFLRWMSLSFPFVAFGVILSRSMFGAGDTITPTWITSLSLLVLQAPGAWFISRYAGYDGVWLSIAGANILNGILMILWYRREKWTRKKI
jgi:putative MATE family efflux protein